MEGILVDELQVYRGEDFRVSDKIWIHQPTLGEICDYGEQRYFNMVYSLTAVGADMKFQLYDIGIDYTKIKDFDLFWQILIHRFTQEDTAILFGDLDFQKFEPAVKTEDIDDGVLNIVLRDEENDITIDEHVYFVIVNYIRSMHGMKRNDQMPANNATKMVLIEDARDEYEINKNKEYHSQLKNMISSMINSEGFKYNHDEVWNMKVLAFFDSVERVKKIKNAWLLLQSGYSGFGIDLKKISNKQLNWLGELD